MSSEESVPCPSTEESYACPYVYRGEQLKEGYVFEFRNGHQILRPDLDAIYQEIRARLDTRGVKLVKGKQRMKQKKGEPVTIPKYRELTCDAYGKHRSSYVKKPVEEGGRPNTKSKKTDCPAHMVLIRNTKDANNPGPWEVKKIVDVHNHPCAKPWKAKIKPEIDTPAALCPCGRPIMTTANSIEGVLLVPAVVYSAGGAKKRTSSLEASEPGAKKAKMHAVARTEFDVLERAASILVGLKKKKYINGQDFDLALDWAEKDPSFSRKLVAVSDPDERLGYVLRQIRKKN